MNKVLDMLDSMEEIRQKTVENPKQYPVDYTIRLCSAIVAQAYGYQSRTEWTSELKRHPESRHYQRYNGDTGQFHI